MKQNIKSTHGKKTVIRNKAFLVFFALCLTTNLLFATTNVWVRPYEIKFNYEAGQNNDALTIKKADGSAATIPEWKYSIRSDKFAYIKSQNSRKIQVRFDSNCSTTMHLVINLNVTSGTGIGEVCNLFVANYTKLSWITITLDGTIPGTVDNRTFTWQWEVYALPVDIANYCAAEYNYSTSHTYYTLLDVPEPPQAEPRIDILDYACDWAAGSSTEYDACANILSNGFNQHYTYTYNCHRLSSNFVHLVSSLGITAYMHQWAVSEGLGYGDMVRQITNVFDWVGPTHGSKSFTWAGHQWAEAASYQWDPSANNSVEGNWGAYEDYLISQYDRWIGTGTERVDNQSGQTEGCEAAEHRVYNYYPTEPLLLFSFQPPTR